MQAKAFVHELQSSSDTQHPAQSGTSENQQGPIWASMQTVAGTFLGPHGRSSWSLGTKKCLCSRQQLRGRGRGLCHCK